MDRLDGKICSDLDWGPLWQLLSHDLICGCQVYIFLCSSCSYINLRQRLKKRHFFSNNTKALTRTALPSKDPLKSFLVPKKMNNHHYKANTIYMLHTRFRSFVWSYNILLFYKFFKFSIKEFHQERALKYTLHMSQSTC